MPAPPLVESPRRQRQLVAVLMFIVFMGSVGAAYLFSEARFDQQRIHFRTEQVDRLQLQVPDHWQTDPQDQQAIGVAGGRVFRNPDRPHQRLRILPVELEQPRPPADMLNHATLALLSEQEVRTFQPLGVQVPSPGSSLQVADVTGVSQPDPNRNEVRVHLIAVMTVDGRTHWIVHLVDQPRANEAPGRVLQHNAILFRHIESSAEVPAADGGPSHTPAEPEGEQTGTEPTTDDASP